MAERSESQFQAEVDGFSIACQFCFLIYATSARILPHRLRCAFPLDFTICDAHERALNPILSESPLPEPVLSLRSWLFPVSTAGDKYR